MHTVIIGEPIIWRDNVKNIYTKEAMADIGLLEVDATCKAQARLAWRTAQFLSTVPATTWLVLPHFWGMLMTLTVAMYVVPS
jgi:hypothetical protein